MKINSDTICALITPPGIGAINVIRVSGDEAITICDSIFRGRRSILNSKTGRVYYGKLINDIDDVILTIFRKPNSYTGEDSVEISFHGNPLIAQKILRLLSDKKVRFAEPGEFTKRAFLNGKLDLVQAESVAQLINSRSEISLRQARSQLDGFLSNKIQKLKDGLIETAGLLELELDFSEEDLEFVDKNELKIRIQKIIADINYLADTYNSGRKIKEGINVGILGKPNVGKSSLLNVLLREDRAIVSDIPGTTRDIIREEIVIDGIIFRFFDTAGLRQSDDLIEEEGIKRSLKVLEGSDVIIFLFDVLEDLRNFKLDYFEKNIKNIQDKEIIKVLNKIDLMNTKINSDDFIAISAKNEIGIDTLKNALVKYAYDKGIYTESGSLVSSERQRDCLLRAKDSLENALISIDKNMSSEFISLDLRKAIDSLKEILGEITTDDILNKIFSSFCIGK